MIQTTRPEADGRRTAVFVFNELRADAGRLTQFWLARLRAFSRAGWATHAALINRDAKLERTVAELVAARRFPSDTLVHHFAMRDRRVRPEAWAAPEPGASLDPVVADWLDWLTELLPGATVFADSPAAYPYLAGMRNPLASLVAGVHLNHLGAAKHGRQHHQVATESAVQVPATKAPAPEPQLVLTPRFAQRFAPYVGRFTEIVVMTQGQAHDLRSQFGASLPITVIPVLAEGPKSTGSVASPTPGLIVSVGALEPAAHHQQAIDALPAVIDAVPEARLEIHGAAKPSEDHGDYADVLRKRAADRGVADRVLIVAPGGAHDPFATAAATVWTARRDSCPLQVVRSLHNGVPVVANDAPYGARELITDTTGVLIPVTKDAQQVARTAEALVQVLTDPSFQRSAAEAAPAMRARTSPADVGRAWCQVATKCEDRLWDREQPHVLAESVDSTQRVLRMPGVLTSSKYPYDQWSMELPGLVEPAAFLSDPRVPGSWNKKERGPDPAFDPHQWARPITVHLRSNALAFVATRTAEQHKLQLTDPTGTAAPLLCAAFDPILIVSRVGNAAMECQSDGSVTIRPVDQLLFAEQVDGRVHARLGAGWQPTDVTHAISWGVDIDWADFEQVPEGLRFSGLLRCRRIAPALHHAPAICVRDLGGYSRAVGQMEFLAEPTILDQSFEVRVGGTIEADPLVSTTALAKGALALHVGYRGLLHPVGGLWTHGRRVALHITCPRGTVTLLPSPGGRILAAPGRGRRARAFGVVKSVLGRK